MYFQHSAADRDGTRNLLQTLREKRGGFSGGGASCRTLCINDFLSDGRCHGIIDPDWNDRTELQERFCPRVLVELGCTAGTGPGIDRIRLIPVPGNESPFLRTIHRDTVWQQSLADLCRRPSFHGRNYGKYAGSGTGSKIFYLPFWISRILYLSGDAMGYLYRHYCRGHFSCTDTDFIRRCSGADGDGLSAGADPLSLPVCHGDFHLFQILLVHADGTRHDGPSAGGKFSESV